MTEIGVDVATIDDVELAVVEACNNAVEHTGVLGYQAQVTVNDGGCVIRVIDSGPGFTGGGPRSQTFSMSTAAVSR